MHAGSVVSTHKLALWVWVATQRVIDALQVAETTVSKPHQLRITEAYIRTRRPNMVLMHASRMSELLQYVCSACFISRLNECVC